MIPFSTLFWNVWVDNQLDAARFHHLQAAIDDIIERYNPDVFGLNEVLLDMLDGSSRLLRHLESHGYHTQFASFGPERSGEHWGSAIASRAKPDSVHIETLGTNIMALRRGHANHAVKLLHATIPVQGTQAVNVLVNYLAHLVPYNWRAHLAHHKNFRAFTANPLLHTRTIIGGDFNQFKFMPRLSGLTRNYHRATGTLRNPTWRWRGAIPGIQANYDNILWSKCGTVHLQDFAILERAPSDHTPLLARFMLQ